MHNFGIECCVSFLYRFNRVCVMMSQMFLACCPSDCLPSINRKVSIPIAAFWLTPHILFTLQIWYKPYAKCNCILWLITMIHLYDKSFCLHLLSFKNMHSISYMFVKKQKLSKKGSHLFLGKWISWRLTYLDTEIFTRLSISMIIFQRHGHYIFTTFAILAHMLSSSKISEGARAVFLRYTL